MRSVADSGKLTRPRGRTSYCLHITDEVIVATERDGNGMELPVGNAGDVHVDYSSDQPAKRSSREKSVSHRNIKHYDVSDTFAGGDMG